MALPHSFTSNGDEPALLREYTDFISESGIESPKEFRENPYNFGGSGSGTTVATKLLPTTYKNNMVDIIGRILSEKCGVNADVIHIGSFGIGRGTFFRSVIRWLKHKYRLLNFKSIGFDNMRSILISHQLSFQLKTKSWLGH